MSLVYVTGIAGSGKSAIQEELVRLGYDAYDADDPSIGAAHNKQTGKITKVPPLEERTPEWFLSHTWKIFRKAVVELKNKSADHIIFLCGTATNEKELYDLFDRIICLDINEATLRKRLILREGNDFGKSEDELRSILKKLKTTRQNYTAN